MYIVQSPAVSDVCVCAVGCHCEAVGHSAGYSAAYVVQSPAVSDVCVCAVGATVKLWDTMLCTVYVVQSPAVSDVCVCAVGCHSEAVGYSAWYSAVYIVQSPAVSDVCALGWNRPHLLLITGQHYQSLACC